MLRRLQNLMTKLCRTPLTLTCARNVPHAAALHAARAAPLPFLP